MLANGDLIVEGSSSFLTGLAIPFLHVRHEESSGVVGGTAGTGSFANTVPLNTVLHNSIDGASLSSSQITLPSGTYYVDGSGVGYDCDAFVGRFRDVTNGLTLIEGSSAFSYGVTAYVDHRTWIRGQFTLPSQADIELQIEVQTATANEGLGVASGFGVAEVYSDIRIWKLR